MDYGQHLVADISLLCEGGKGEGGFCPGALVLGGFCPGAFVRGLSSGGGAYVLHPL